MDEKKEKKEKLIECPHCTYMENAEGDYCSKCGEKLRKRVPVTTRIRERVRAWREKRKDAEKEKLSMEVVKLAQTNKELDELLKEKEEQLTNVIADRGRTIKEKDAEIAAHFKDRDENWIPLSNKLKVYVKRYHLMDLWDRGERFEIEGTVAGCMPQRKGDIVLFSKKVLPTKDGA